MTSLFEAWPIGRGTEMPLDLMDGGGRGVSLLEFFAIEEDVDAEVAVVEVQAAPETAASERAAQLRAMIDAARAEAKAEARREGEAALADAIADERERVDRACAEFARDRQRYFAAAEAQVVKLALAVARRVLAREVAADPMHLTATVRAALARMQDGSASVLRVPPQELAPWTQTFAKACDGAVSVVADERLHEGDCVLETEVGRVELSVAVQMAEIERGFAHLTQRQGE